MVSFVVVIVVTPVMSSSMVVEEATPVVVVVVEGSTLVVEGASLVDEAPSLVVEASTPVMAGVVASAVLPALTVVGLELAVGPGPAPLAPKVSSVQAGVAGIASATQATNSHDGVEAIATRTLVECGGGRQAWREDLYGLNLVRPIESLGDGSRPGIALGCGDLI